MTNSNRSPSEILGIVVSRVKSPGDSNVQPGLRNTRLMETILSRETSAKSFLNFLKTKYIVLKLHLYCPAFPKRGKWYTKSTVVALTLRQILDPERKHTVYGRLQQDLSGIRYQVAQTPNGITGLVDDCYEPSIHLDVYKKYKSIMPHYPHYHICKTDDSRAQWILH